MASGRPVVASGLPELDRFDDLVERADDAAGFVAACERALDVGAAGAPRRRELAAGNSWDARAERLMELVDRELRRGGD